MTYRRLQKRYGGPIMCRWCINQHTHRHIRHTECKYYPGNGLYAPAAAAEAYIVKSLKLSAKIKLWMD